MAKVSFRSSASQANHAAQGLDLDSVRTEKNYEGALKGVAEFLQENRLGDLRSLDAEKAMAYLEARGQEVSQKTLDMDRQAIQAVIGEKLPVIPSEKTTTLESRAYTGEQAKMVADAQSEKHSLATQIAENAGLRAHELLTLRPVEERQADTHREYRDDRFTGRDDVKIYTVEGKGGLCREVAIDRALADNWNHAAWTSRASCTTERYDMSNTTTLAAASSGQTVSAKPQIGRWAGLQERMACAMNSPRNA